MTFKIKLFFLFCVGLCQHVLAQNDTIITLKEVKITDWQLKNNSKSQLVQTLNDSLLSRSASFTTLLQNNSVLYFKENGLGMVASPSFRGTTAQQTAVIWNGININSQFNGQTDFNAVSFSGFDNVNIKAGGGSALYGSGAIGGTVHLNNILEFKEKANSLLQISYGSFETFRGNFDFKKATKKWSLHLNGARFQSKNDFPYQGTNFKNENAAFLTHQLSGAFGYRFNNRNIITYFGQFFESDRQFSGTLAMQSKSKYKMQTSRNVIDWTYNNNKWISKLKLAHLFEDFQYFEDQYIKETSFGAIQSTILKYDSSYPIDKNLNLNIISDYNYISGWATNMDFNSRQINSNSILMKHKVGDEFSYNVSLRKELTNVYSSPFLYAFGWHYEISKHYALRFNESKNFRIPTFNDMYWPGSGNKNLKPESAYLTEIGQDVTFFKNIQWNTTFYMSKIEDMIQWIPGNDGNWKPQNVSKVNIVGIETMLQSKIKLGSQNIQASATYAYTVSKDGLTDKQLVYVPYHKANANLSYYYKKWNLNYTYLYNGKVFTSTDNVYSIKNFMLSDVSAYYQYGKVLQYQFGFQVLNLFNENYQNVAQRPMPGRNFNLSLTIKF